ncbi:hypothetical protein SAMN04488029_2168 [Reichenbachiella faecimaris]|uniref:Glycosyltransferase RgtA/B/C/D-like domain-containing protein n=1 Tax=Reichenbachiella faecimaris TaxID=692418 RepID=A0A1W2GDM8_REIFA|nr:hypothetical protein [Reichenbachiella faecimaris]SMD34755.1 hypothetical protein SAMN04488029_2168 [Reichenbachiella faecimaris]
MLLPSSTRKDHFWIYGLAMVFYGLYYWMNVPKDYSACTLCDGHQYAKLYWYFEHGMIAPIKFPFYNRPLVPWLVSLIPGSSIGLHFDLVNFAFFVISIWAIRSLWLELQLKFWVQLLGFGWLIIHWTGIIRLNLYDNLTVDVPLYFFQALALLLFLKKDYKWFLLLVPVALLQKESFLAIMVVFIGIHFVYNYHHQPWKQGRILILSTLIGLLIQKTVLYYLPEQLDQRSSLDAILYHGHWALKDPSRFIRWFTAFGSAYGLLPLAIFLAFGIRRFKDSKYTLLLVLSLMYSSFGLLAGEDMTRILFLGFPFIMTLTLRELQGKDLTFVFSALGLSLISLRLLPIPVDTHWAIDYAELAHVWNWFFYYSLCVIVLLLIHQFKTNKNNLRS